MSTQTPAARTDEPPVALTDDEIDTVWPAGATQAPARAQDDADGTDGDAGDGDSTDGSDADGADADGADADGADADGADA